MQRIFSLVIITLAIALPSNALADVVIAMYGDSTTKGAQTIEGILRVTNRNEPDALQELLRARFPDAAITVQNNGVGGTQASQLVKGQDGVHRPFIQEIAASNADIVIFNYCLNDRSYSDGHDPKFEAVSPLQYWGYLSQLITITRQHGKIPVLQEPNPTAWQPSPGLLATYVYILRQVAADMNVPIVSQYDYIQQIPDWKSYLSEDGVHPKDALYAIKAKRTFDVITPIIAQGLVD